MQPATVKGADLMVRALENESVECIFGVPGEENLDFLEALRTSRIELVVTRHEQVAGFMAATYGRLIGRPGVCFSTLGPGATNLVTPAAFASLGGMPMVIITGQKPILQSRQAQFQMVDIVSLMRPLTKSAKQVLDARNIPTLVRDAFRTALAERPGPVHRGYRSADNAPCRRRACDRGAASGRARPRGRLRRSAAAQHPLVMIASGANRPGLATKLSAAVRRLGIPFFTTQMGKGAIDGNSALFIGTTALSENDYVHRAIGRADLIVAIGHDTVEKPPSIMREGGPNVVHVDFNSANIDQIYFPQAEVIGDIADSVGRLADHLDGKLSHDPSYFLKIRDYVLAHTGEGADDPRFPMAPQRIVAEVRRVMPDDGIICLDNGMYKIWFARSYRTHISNTILLDNALATMGAGLASAMMAAKLYPGRRVMAVCGDGGFMMNAQDLETAIRLGLNLVVLIIEDHGYGMIRWKQAAMGLENFGLSFANPDFVRYAEAYGAKGVRVAAADQVFTTLDAAFTAGGVHLVVVPVDYSENNRVLIDELAEKLADFK